MSIGGVAPAPVPSMDDADDVDGTHGARPPVPAAPPVRPLPGTLAAASAGHVSAMHRLVPPPRRNPELAHLDLKRLRAYRRTLLADELRVSYWRRLLQARRDLLTARGPLTVAGLQEVLAESRPAGGRQVMMALHPQAGMPVLPHLPALWATATDFDDLDDRRDMLRRLGSAEAVLSSYREALHKRLDRATTEVVARYAEDPASCLSALAAV